MLYNRAYTLIEVLVVILLIMVLTGLLLPVAQTSMERMRISRAKSDIAKIESAAEAYQSKYGVHPAEVPTDKVPISKLVEFVSFPPKQISSANLLLDPWAQEYRYKRNSLNHPNFVDIAASGPDGQIDGEWQKDSNLYNPAADPTDANDDNVNNWSEKR